MGKVYKDSFLYEEISTGLEERILDNTFKPGDKLPSVRLLSKQHGVSASTIFQAYYRLEAKGLIEARPKSGYYVLYQKPYSKTKKNTQNKDVSVFEVNTQSIMVEMEEIRTSDHILRLSNAIPDVSLLPSAKINKSVKEALNDSNHQLLEYAPVQGDIELRTQVCRHLLHWGGNFGPDELIITNGCIEAINLCLRALCEPGDVVVTDELTYFGIHQSIENLGLKVIPIPQADEDGICLDLLESAFRQYPVKICLFVLNFSNPVGSCMPDAKKKKLYELLVKYQIPLIEDDVYGELYFGKNRPSCVKRFDTEGLVLYCSSFSKTLSPGFRIGYCLPGKYLSEVIRQKRISTYSVNTMAQVALVNFLKTGRYDYHLRKLRNSLHKQQIYYTQLIIKHFPKEVFFTPPKGGLVFWLEFPERFNAYELFIRAKDAQLGIAPGHIFSVSAKPKNFIRISFGNTPNEKVEQGFQKLGDIIKKILESEKS